MVINLISTLTKQSKISFGCQKGSLFIYSYFVPFVYVFIRRIVAVLVFTSRGSSQ